MARTRFIALSLGPLLLALSCSTTPGKPPNAPNSALPAAGNQAGDDQAGAGKGDGATDELPMPPGQEVSFNDFLGRVEHVRQLKSRAPVFGLRVEEDDLIAHVERSFKKELPEHALRGTEDMLVALGTVPHGFDFQAAMLGLLRSQLAGLYDPRKNAMFVRSALEGEELDATLLHELVHALQDQAYHLDEFSAYKEDGTDRASALSALAEGDATSAMYDGMLLLLAERQHEEPKTALDLPLAQLTAGMEASAEVPEEGAVPRIIRRSLIAPYRDGLTFVQQLRQKGGWAEVDAAWQHPPDSTEQVLHVERFFKRELPVPTAPIAPPSAEWKKLLTDVWGEQSLRLVFEESEESTAAGRRATGWGGDRIAVYGDGDRRVLTWHLTADDPAAAKRYAEGFRLLAGGKVHAAADGFCQERPKIGPLAVSQKGQHVVILAGPYDRRNESAPAATCQQNAAWRAQAIAEL